MKFPVMKLVTACFVLVFGLGVVPAQTAPIHSRRALRIHPKVRARGCGGTG